MTAQPICGPKGSIRTQILYGAFPSQAQKVCWCSWLKQGENVFAPCASVGVCSKSSSCAKYTQAKFIESRILLKVAVPLCRKDMVVMHLVQDQTLILLLCFNEYPVTCVSQYPCAVYHVVLAPGEKGKRQNIIAAACVNKCGSCVSLQ